MKQLNESIWTDILLLFQFYYKYNKGKGTRKDQICCYLLANIRPAHARTLYIVWGAAVLGTIPQDKRDSKHSGSEGKHFMDGGPKITRLVGWNTYLHFSGNT